MKYIVEFPDFGQRDEWAAKHPDAVVYKNHPWLAVELSEAQVCELEQRQGMRLYPDVQVKPA